MRAYDILKALHIFLVIIWLGTDVGTFASFSRLLDPSLSVPTRLSMSRLSDILDQGPRSALVLLLMLGLTMTHMGGWGLRGSGGTVLSIAAAIIGVVWFVGVWHQFWVHHPPGGTERSSVHIRASAQFRVFDLWWRVAVATVLLVGAVWSLAVSGDGGPLQYSWLAWKLILFAFIVFDGVLIRLALPKIGAAVGAIAQGGSTPEREAALLRVARPAQGYVIGLWILLVAITVLAVFKPGM